MDDLISRKAALDAISCNITVTGRQNAELVAQTIGRFADRIKALPSAQPKPGKWLRTSAYPHHIYCSVCYATYVPNDEWEIWENAILPRKFCPNCGAPMEEENNEQRD